MGWHNVATVAQIEEGEAFPVSVGRIEIAVLKVGDQLHGISNVCTHEYAVMSDGFVEDGCIECPLHQAKFDVATGEHLSGPGCDNLRTFPIKIVDGAVFVECD